MAFRVLAIFVAVALAQMVTAQCSCSGGYGIQAVSPISLGSISYGSGNNCGCASNLGYNGANIINSGLNCGSSNLAGISSQGVDALTIAVGSSIAPSSISVNAENLEIGGQLRVNGQLPVLGAVAVSGGLPTGGQGQVQYNSASGVGLTSGGCGYGLPSSAPSVGFGSSGQVGNILGFSGCNYGQGYSQSCRCGL